MLGQLHDNTMGLFGDSSESDVKTLDFSAAVSLPCFVKAAAGFVGQLETVGKVVLLGRDLQEGQFNSSQMRYSHSSGKLFGKSRSNTIKASRFC